ncbi:MAG: hypothetical protein IJX64_02545 [Clostridia bacterium]|nr:hypothetical protein [Clostridia bacterium]
MLLSFNECLNKYGNLYQINKMIESKQLYKLEPGIYSDKERVSELEFVSYKYPHAIFTMDSAFYYHGLTDVIPSRFCLATKKNARIITDKHVKQFFHRNEIFDIGVSALEQGNTQIRIYDQERMLIELVRNKNTLPFDYYKEIIESYRKRIDSLDIEKLQEYISVFPKQNYIFETIQLEVF